MPGKIIEQKYFTDQKAFMSDFGASLDKKLSRPQVHPLLSRKIKFKEYISTSTSTSSEIKMMKKSNKVIIISNKNYKKKLNNQTSESPAIATNGNHSTADKLSTTDSTYTISLSCSDKVPLDWQKIVPIGPGLINVGNTCFLNSVLQCLTYTAPLSGYLVQRYHGKDCRGHGFCLMCEFEKHVVHCLSGSRDKFKNAICPKNIVSRLKLIAKSMRVGRQEDAHEFMRFFIDGMHKSCTSGTEKIKENSFISQVFGGYLRSRVHCMTCGYNSDTIDPMLDLSLEIKHCDTLEKALKVFTKPELLSKSNQYKCSKCHKKTDAKKKITVHNPPTVLTVQFKRFDFTKSMFGHKVNKPVAFQQSLDLYPYLSHSTETCMYELYAVLVHAGSSCNSGHYYCYVKGPSGAWYEMNDCSVRQVSLNTVLKTSAYMIFYKKTHCQKDQKKNENPFNNSIGSKNTSSVAQNEVKKISSHLNMLATMDTNGMVLSSSKQDITLSNGNLNKLKKDSGKKINQYPQHKEQKISSDAPLYSRDIKVPDNKNSKILENGRAPIDEKLSNEMQSIFSAEESISTKKSTVFNPNEFKELNLNFSYDDSVKIYDQSVPSWESVDQNTVRSRSDIMNDESFQVKKMKRPSQWDVEYDRGYQKKTKTQKMMNAALKRRQKGFNSSWRVSNA